MLSLIYLIIQIAQNQLGSWSGEIQRLPSLGFGSSYLFKPQNFFFKMSLWEKKFFELINLQEKEFEM